MTKHKKLKTILYAMVGMLLLTSSMAQARPQTDTYNGGRGTSFNSGWKFFLGDIDGPQNAAFDDASWRNLNLPHDWSIEFSYDQKSLSKGGGGYLDGGIGWYRKSFTLSKSDSGKKIRIQFDGIYMDSEVWINGQFLGNRPNGYNSFEYDLTPYVHFDNTPNILTVKAKNQQPSSRWYSGSGIYRNVWLTKLDPIHVAYCGTYITTPSVSTTTATANIKTEVRNETQAAQKVKITTVISDAKGQIKSTQTSTVVTISANGQHQFDQTLKVANPNLWSPTTPNMYRVKTIVTKMSGAVAQVDTYNTPLGIRTIKFDPDNGFSINGKRLKIKGTVMHQDFGCLGRALSYRAMERQFEILKAMGCNAIRTAHTAPSPEFTELCDRMGIMVMEEAFDCWEARKEKNDYGRFFKQWAEIDLKGQISRDRNNPCVIMWSIGNEIWGPTLATAQKLKNWVHALDTTRMITWASNGMGSKESQEVANILDLAGYNYSTGLYVKDHKANPTRIIFGSETCAARRSRGIYVFPSTKIFGNLDPDLGSSYDNSLSTWGKTSAENDWKAHNEPDFVAGEFIWTGFDYLGENDWPTISNNDGIVDRCGFPKDIYYFYQSQWTEKPMIHILPHWNWAAGQKYLTATNGVKIDTADVPNAFKVPVWVYTNCDSVELFLDNKSLGVQKFQQGGALHLEWIVPFAPGTLRAVGKRAGVSVAQETIRTAEAPSQIRLSADRKTIKADGDDVVFITADVLDANGTFHPMADNTIKYTVSGPGKVVGVDNGNSLDHSAYKSDTRNAYAGKCLAVVRANGIAGPIVITATSPGLTSQSITIVSVALSKTKKSTK